MKQGYKGRAYVVLYNPPDGYVMNEWWRDTIMSTGGVLEIRESALYSLQFTQMGLDRITRRPLTLVLMNMADRYGYAEGGEYETASRICRWEPFEAIVVSSFPDIEKVCLGQRYREREGKRFDNGWPDKPIPGGYPSEDVIFQEWYDLETGKVITSSYRPVKQEASVG